MFFSMLTPFHTEQPNFHFLLQIYLAIISNHRYDIRYDMDLEFMLGHGH